MRPTAEKDSPSVTMNDKKDLMKVTPKQVEYLKNLFAGEEEAILAKCGVKRFEDLQMSVASKIISEKKGEKK